MKGIPLIETNDAGLIARAYNLGLKTVPNFSHVLTREQLEYWERNLPGLKEALTRSLIIPGQETEQKIQATPTVVVPTIVAPPAIFKTADTDLNLWLTRAQEFAKKYLGVDINLREKFEIPEELPWASAIPIFDPGGLTNREALNKVLKMFGPNKPYEEVDVMKYSGSEAGAVPTLHLIENSVRPNNDTMGMSPDNLVAIAKSWLRLRGYTLAFALHYSVTNGYLDPQTWTWFPADRLAPSGGVADGCWNPGYSRVRFGWNDSWDESPGFGARLAIQCPLKP